MNKSSKVVLFLAVILAGGIFNLSSGQSTENTDSVLVLKTNLEASFVFADSLFLGKANQGSFIVPEGTREIRLVPPEVDSWSISPVVSPYKTGGDTLALNFPFHYKVESLPFNASVYLESTDKRELLGSTPLLFTSDDPVEGKLLLALDGYESLRLLPGNDVWNQHLVELEELSSEDLVAEGYWKPEKRSNKWIDYTAAGVAIVSGVLAIRYKTKANSRFDTYRVSGDPSLRSGFERYDRYSAISLGAMQAGIGVLAIRFVIK